MLIILKGVITDIGKRPANVITLTWYGIKGGVSKVPVNPKAPLEAKDLYQTLLRFYGKKVLSEAMAEVAWNTKEVDRVHRLTGKYPAVNGFDYLYLLYPGENWINYTDITLVVSWVKAGGIVTIPWHWNVPTQPLAADIQVFSTGKEQYYAVTDAASRSVLAKGRVGDKIFVRCQDARRMLMEACLLLTIRLLKMIAE